jgi:hypothetical protein
MSRIKTEQKFVENLLKILLRGDATSLTGLKVFYDCSGGNSRPSRLSGVGGGNFLRRQSVFSPLVLVLLLLLLLVLDYNVRGENAQRSTSNVQCQNQQTLVECPGRPCAR